MSLTPEERILLIRIDERTSAMLGAMTNAEGDMRCTTHEQQLKTLFKKVDSANNWVKGLVATLIGGGLLTLFTLVLTHLAK